MRTFYLIAITQVISVLGSRMSGFAIALWVTKETGNATPLALVALFNVLPTIFLSNVAGWVADRYNRRVVMAVSDAGQALGTLLLLFSFTSGNFQLWHLYVVALLQSAVGIFQNPAAQASITMLVPDNKRETANAIAQIIGPIAGLVAPALAAALYAVINVSGLILVDIATFLISVTVLMFIRIPQPPRDLQKEAQESWFAALMGGFTFLWTNRMLFWTMMFAALCNVVFNAAGALFVPYVLARTGNEQIVGLVSSAEGIGAIAGAIIISAWGGTRPRIHGIMIALILCSISFGLLGISQHPIALGAFVLFMMLPNAVVNVSFMSLMQSKIPPDLQGRVFAAMMQVAMILSPIGLVAIGPLADTVFEPAVRQPVWAVFAPIFGTEKGAGMGLLISLAGMLVAVSSILFYAWPAVRQMEAKIPDAIPSDVDSQRDEQREVIANQPVTA
jgi:MFS family permease